MKSTLSKEPRIHSVQFNFIMNAILTVSSFLFPLITFPYISRTLLVEGSGKVNFASSVINYFAMFASLGIPTYGIRACAQVRNNRKELTKVAQELLLINLITTAITYVAFFASLFVVERFQQDTSLLLISSISIVLNTLGVTWLYSALEQYSYITIRNIACKILSVVLMFIFVHNPSDYMAYAIIAVVASGGSNLWNFINLRRYISLRPVGSYRLKRHLKPILVFFATSVAVSVYTNLDTVMLGFMADDTQVGLYSASVKVKTLLLAVVSSLGNVLMPRLSLYVQSGDYERFTKTLSRVLNFLLLITLPLTVFFALYAKDSILFLSGEAFVGATLSMQLLMPTLLFNALNGMTGNQMLVPLGRERAVMVSVIVGAVLDFLLNLVVIPYMGAAGAALSTLAAEFAVLVVQIFYLKRTLLPVVRGVRYRPILVSLAAATAAVLALLRTVSPASAFLRLVVGAVTFFGVYLLFLLLQKEPFLFENMTNLRQKWQNRHKGA